MKLKTCILRNNESSYHLIKTGWLWILILIFSAAPAIANSILSENDDYRLLVAELLDSEYTQIDQTMDSALAYQLIDSLSLLIRKQQENKTPELESEKWIELGKIYLKMPFYSAADSCFSTAEMLIPETNITKKASFYHNIANAYQRNGLYRKAQKNYEAALFQYEEAKDKNGMAHAMHDAAKNIEKLGDFTKAIGLMQQALDLYQDVGNNDGIALLKVDIGDMLQKWHKSQVAIKHYNEAYNYFQKNNDAQKMMLIQIKLGQISLNDNQFHQAQIYFSNAMKIKPESNSTTIRGLLFMNLGDVYKLSGDPITALKFYTKASLIYQINRDQIGYIRALQHQGDLYISLPNYQKADSVVRQSLDLAIQSGYKEYQMNGWRLLAEINGLTKNFEFAFHCLKNAAKIKDELFTKEGNKLISELLVQFETEKVYEAYQTLLKKNQKTNTALKKQQDTGSFTIILATFIILVSLIIIIFVIVRTRESKKSYALLTLKNKKISDQKEILSKLNLKLTQSREQYRSIVENASVGMYQTSPDGKICFANAALKRMLRYPEDLDVNEINLNAENPDRQTFVNLIEEKGVITGREDVWIRYDGTFLDVNESAWLVKNREHKTHYYEGVVEDISKRKAAEKALNESQDKLRSINKELTEKNIQIEKSKNEAVTANEIKSIFLANVSHEIRTPMNSIIGFSEILSQGNPNEQQLYYINAIKSSSSNLLALLNDILDLSKIQSNEIKLIYEPISLNEIVKDIVKMFQLRYKENTIKMVVKFIKPFPELIKMDGLRMRQILINLIGNAIKFTDKGGIYLTISASHQSKDRCNLKIEIRDTGIGIAKEEFETIFEAFKQSKFLGDKAYSGTGLGLSITKQLIDNMGGSISLESKLNLGTTFFVNLPHIEIAHSGSRIRAKNYPHYPEINGAEISKSIINDTFDATIPEMSDELQTKLLLSFGTEWIKLNRSHLVPELSIFSEHLKQFSEKESIFWLHQFAEELFEACQRFDVDKIESLNKKLKNIFAEQTQK